VSIGKEKITHLGEKTLKQILVL